MSEVADAETFARISQELLAEPDEPATLRKVADRAVEVVAACDFCGVALCVDGGALETAVWTSSVVVECAALQDELGEGPGRDIAGAAEVDLVEDTSSEPRWPRWGEAVAARGVGSMLSVRLFTTTRTIGYLHLYAHRPYAFGPEDVDVAVVYAAHAATALLEAKLISGLQTAVRTRHLIGLAQGIVMNRYGITPEQAFEVLRRFSTRTHTKLREVAQTIVDTGHLPVDGSYNPLPAKPEAPSDR